MINTNTNPTSTTPFWNINRKMRMNSKISACSLFPGESTWLFSFCIIVSISLFYWYDSISYGFLKFFYLLLSLIWYCMCHDSSYCYIDPPHSAFNYFALSVIWRNFEHTAWFIRLAYTDVYWPFTDWTLSSTR